MSGFAEDWLALREPADARARDPHLLRKLASAFEGRESVTIADLGCGAGANLRAMAAVFPRETRQNWRLIDHDPRLLAAARRALAAWADGCAEHGARLLLEKYGRRIEVDLIEAGLENPSAAFAGEPVDIATASAFFDLVSREWIAGFARAASGVRAVYAPLIYDGRESWTPPHPADAAMLAAFHAHQQGDKGFGKAAGPDAADLLAASLKEAGFTVETAPSPWRLGERDYELINRLAEGSAGAIAELGFFDAGAVADWRESRRRASGCLIGHQDVLALRPH
jgi:SAM-dependent methyltransferase